MHASAWVQAVFMMVCDRLSCRSKQVNIRVSLDNEVATGSLKVVAVATRVRRLRV